MNFVKRGQNWNYLEVKEDKSRRKVKLFRVILDHHALGMLHMEMELKSFPNLGDWGVILGELYSCQKGGNFYKIMMMHCITKFNY